MPVYKVKAVSKGDCLLMHPSYSVFFAPLQLGGGGLVVCVVPSMTCSVSSIIRVQVSLPLRIRTIAHLFLLVIHAPLLKIQSKGTTPTHHATTPNQTIGIHGAVDSVVSVDSILCLRGEPKLLLSRIKFLFVTTRSCWILLGLMMAVGVDLG